MPLRDNGPKNGGPAWPRGRYRGGVSDAAALAARDLSAGYDGRIVLAGIDLELHAGELVAVLGANGTGKSTLLRALAGTLGLLAGTVLVQGQPLGGLSRREVAQRVGVVPQESEVAFGFTVREVVAMGRAPHQSGLMLTAPRDEALIAKALDACDLGELAARRVSDLSGGERRRVTIARALAQDTAILLLDEPAAFLDVRHALTLFEIVRREISERNLACLAVVHDLSQAARFADRVVLLADGKIAAQGSIEEAMTANVLQRVFGVPVRVGRDESTGLQYFLPGA